MKRKFKLIDISILITIASTTLYVVFRNLGREAGSFAFLWAPITLLLILLTRPATFYNKTMRLIFIYGGISVGILQYLLWDYMNDWNKNQIIYEFYYLIIIVSIFLYYCDNGGFYKLALLSKWTFIFIIISLFLTNVALYFDPNLVRESANTGGYSPFQSKLYNLTGAMGYSYVQAIICLIPILIYHIKAKKKMVIPSKYLFIILILIFITEIQSQVFANILVTFIIIIFSIFSSRKRQASVITIILIAILIIAVPNSFYSGLFNSLSTYFAPESVMHEKLTDFATFTDNPEVDITTGAGGRAARYPLLFDALAANPFFGDASTKSSIDISGGAHLYWMNRLALWGIPGFVFFIFVLYRIFKRVNLLFNDDYKFYYFLSVASFIMLGLMKTIGGRENWLILIVVIPGLYFLPLLQKNRTLRRKI